MWQSHDIAQGFCTSTIAGIHIEQDRWTIFTHRWIALYTMYNYRIHLNMNVLQQALWISGYVHQTHTQTHMHAYTHARMHTHTHAHTHTASHVAMYLLWRGCSLLSSQWTAPLHDWGRTWEQCTQLQEHRPHTGSPDLSLFIINMTTTVNKKAMYLSPPAVRVSPTQSYSEFL